MKIEILGMGCPRCRQLARRAEDAARALGKEVEVIKVDDLETITGYGVLSTPALVVDGMVKATGRVPEIEEIKGWIK